MYWEIKRALENGESKKIGAPTEPCTKKQWEKIRDLLADIWDWWSEGVHLRPQPYYEEGTYDLRFREPLAVTICKKDRIRSDRGENRKLPPMPRTTSIDAHLGDGLIRMTAVVHAALALSSGFAEYDLALVPSEEVFFLKLSKVPAKIGRQSI